MASTEPHPDPVALTASNNTSKVDYTPYPEKSIPVSSEQQATVDAICRLYSGSASKDDMQVYAPTAIYDDPWSYCDNRYKVAGQWYGIPKIMASSRTLATEIVDASPSLLVFKLRQEYTPRVLNIGKAVNSLVSLSLDKEGKVTYHKDMWNEKDYSHEGLGKVMKTLNGDYLTKITRPEGDL
ncbi:hypothetical protein BU16DRAFT_528142 [Lophium mytilinum]|uniref:SnoaL-like domain-containing protein n=1 Tax=Lophium mytilinum TaxID=390894 RepID=A0A6A6QPA8_9PEZI|nr:hypothetical protein BU16DRAFT_528142 [Lophium mytilinum]